MIYHNYFYKFIKWNIIKNNNTMSFLKPIGDFFSQIFPKGCTPEDCETSEEARTIANRLDILAGSAYGEAGGAYGVGGSFAASSRYYSAADFHKRADYLQSIGK